MLNKLIAIVTFLLLACLLNGRGQAQSPEKPFILPITSTPSPSTWLLGQFYGNTVDAYNFGRQWYTAGQGVHFGLDLFAPCGTPAIAAADGMVHGVDALSFGAGPHNVILIHEDLNLVTLYGHLVERSLLIEGQPIKQGEVVGYVGDADGVCLSRPHLHFEVRSRDYQTTFNPIPYIEAPWHTLASIGAATMPQFERDLYNPRRWLSPDDQPNVTFGGGRLNNYNRAWPSTIENRAPVNATPDRPYTPIPTTAWQMHPVTDGNCCAYPWWDVSDSNRFYTIDGNPDQRAQVFEWTLEGESSVVGDAPPVGRSPDGTHQLSHDLEGHFRIENLLTEEVWLVYTEGESASLSTDNNRLLWDVSEFSFMPGEIYPIVKTYVSDKDGSNSRQIWEQPGGQAMWLDETRVLIVTPVLDQTDTTLTVFDTETDSYFTLGTWNWLRGLSVAPGGDRLMFYLMWQGDPSIDGIYTIETQQGAVAQRLSWFGAWRWRDSESIYFLPFNTSWYNNDQQVLAFYHLPTGQGGMLTDLNTLPFTIADGDWSVSPDGTTILFRNAQDMNLWVMQAQ